MNEQIPVANQSKPENSKVAALKTILTRIKSILNPYIERFKHTRLYTNKAYFYPLAGLSGLLFLTILAGLLFGGNKKATIIQVRPTPTPLILENLQTPPPSGDAVSQINDKLLDIKNQINNLDVKQSRLQPPTIDFKISF